ncbi:PfkB family carbohydrate kinase [Dactylosporangium sp. CS-033363]|uniref:PfkB family carbohydrate kinase n=1 Tax=Dactylosporangium sp. CS-033363 TaxID=3239935 RepID=UPI003D90C534
MTAARLVVIGDTLLDSDVDGTVRRVSPDAPALVLDEESTVDRPGGAGLAALLAAADGLDVTLVTALADDAGGLRLTELLSAAGVRLHAVTLPGPTPEKVRLRAGGQVLLRLDRGGADPAPPTDPAGISALLDRADAILVSDYGRGLTGRPGLRAALDATRTPFVWDPHPRGAAPVPGARLATPNEAEARLLSEDAGGGGRIAAATRAGHELRRRWRAAAVAVTTGASGAVLCHAGPTPLIVPAPQVAEGDSCGAGDRFAAAAAGALAQGALPTEAVTAAVRAASAYVGRFFVDSAEKQAVDRVRARGGTVVATGGCFDLLHAGHIATLEAARSLGDCLVVCLNSDASVRGLKGPERPVVPAADRARLLEALWCVDAVVVFDEPTPEAVLARLRPDIWVKGGDYADGGPELPEADLVERWGGQTVIVPYLEGRSTTSLIGGIRT